MLTIVSGVKVETNKEFIDTKLFYPFKHKHSKVIDEEVNKLIEKQVIKRVPFDESLILSPIFLVNKKQGGKRLILDLKEFNQYAPYKHFKSEHFETILQLISPGMYMGSYDIKDAYYSVSIAEEHRKYFSFSWKGNYYSFKALPQGWAHSPYYFTKLLKPVFYLLRSEGFINSYFLDDSILLGDTIGECRRNITVTGDLLTNLGFILNVPKSVTEPTQVMLHLGNIIDTVNMIVYLPNDKKEKLIDLCKSLVNQKTAKIREVAKVVGTMVASFQAVTYGKLFYRELEKEKIKALKQKQGNFDETMNVTEAMKLDLKYWIDNIKTEIRYIQVRAIDITIQTDSSLIGWACVSDTSSVQGRWSIEESEYHINVLELKAILLSIACFKDEFKDKHVKILTDSTTAVNYINNMGGIKSNQCNTIAKKIWEFCRVNGIWISCAHIPGIENEADRPSRKFNDDSEWQISQNIFEKVCSTWHAPQIDLFASRLNHKLEIYCSWRRDPFSKHINAFSIPWDSYKLVYIFSPFSIIGRCLRKIIQDRAEAIMILPLWPSQAWFPLLLGILIDNPRILPETSTILSLPYKTKQHRLAGRMRMIACRVSGDCMKAKEFLRRQPKLSWHHGENPPRKAMKHTYKDGTYFVKADRRIQFIHL